MNVIVGALALIVLGGVGALGASRWSRLSSALAVLGVVAGAAAGLAAAFGVLAGGGDREMALSWGVPYGDVRIALDPLSAFFLVPVFALSALAAVYGRGYLAPHAAKRSLGFTWLAFNVLVASMAVVVIAQHAVLFLVAWEVMSLAAYLLVTFEHEDAAVRRAGWTYLIATHAATACLIAMFVVLGDRAHGYDFAAIRAAGAPGPALSALLFLLALCGFGVKAGFVPFHVWLPEAHAAAPSHVSAVMSGVLIKMGIYGVLRAVTLLGHPSPWWGPLLMGIGLVGGLFGIALALYQRDIKRVLAYSSIENVGLIALGLGMGLWGAASGRPNVAMLGTLGALLHVWNHSLMKGLLFLGAGSVVHGAGTRDIEHLGGLLKRMPRTGVAMVVGAVAISALPPMNGFVGEWLMYLGLLDGALDGDRATVAPLFAVGVVSLIGGLAVLCFVRLVGVVLLGQPRGAAARGAHESPASMTVPMAILALLAIGVAVAPGGPTAAAARVGSQILGAPIVAERAHADTLGVANAVIWCAILVGMVILRLVQRGRPIATDATWGCGYARPSPRMQYTGRSFAELVSERLLPKRLRARVSVVLPSALFSERASLSSTYEDPLTRAVYEPFLSRWGDRFARLRWVQQGMLHVYLVYILVAVLLALGWTSLRAWSGL